MERGVVFIFGRGELEDQILKVCGWGWDGKGTDLGPRFKGGRVVVPEGSSMVTGGETNSRKRQKFTESSAAISLRTRLWRFPGWGFSESLPD